MLNLSIILFIQFVFCLGFFLYFRKKFQEALKLKDFRNDIDELIISFNRQAERHINYLEKLLDNELIKKNLRSFEQTKTTLPNDEDNLTTTPTPLENLTGKSYTKPKNTKPIPLPPKLVKSYYEKFSGITTDEQTEEEPVNSKTSLSTPTQTVKKANPDLILNNQKNPTKQPSLKPNSRKQLINNILLLADKGGNSQTIAKRLAISTAEVKLILKLNKSDTNHTNNSNTRGNT